MKTFNQILITIVLIAILGVAIFFGVQQLQGKEKGTRQAVFLTNGQVYFGYVSGENRRTVKMKEIYYLQVQQPLQPPKEGESEQQPQVSLVKLGKELHGPKDEMRINREHILFIEDMNDDSKVNEAINDFVKNGGQTTASPSPAPTQ